MHVRFAILGARGLIGGAVARRARFAGHQVRAEVRPGREAQGFPSGIEVVPADLRSRESVVEAVHGVDVVVHAATVPYPEWPRFVPLFAENALAAAEAAGATLVFPGNVYVYGRPRSRFVAEDHPQEPHTVKGRIRLGVERKFLQAHQDGRVDLVLPRYPDVYGPGAIHADFRPVFEGALANKPCRWPLNADALHEFILNDDAAEAMLKLIGTPAAHGRAVHVPGPRAIVSRDFIRLVYAAAGSGEPIVRVFGRHVPAGRVVQPVSEGRIRDGLFVRRSDPAGWDALSIADRRPASVDPVRGRGTANTGLVPNAPGNSLMLPSLLYKRRGDLSLDGSGSRGRLPHSGGQVRPCVPQRGGR